MNRPVFTIRARRHFASGSHTTNAHKGELTSARRRLCRITAEVVLHYSDRSQRIDSPNAICPAQNVTRLLDQPYRLLWADRHRELGLLEQFLRYLTERPHLSKASIVEINQRGHIGVTPSVATAGVRIDDKPHQPEPEANTRGSDVNPTVIAGHCTVGSTPSAIS